MSTVARLAGELASLAAAGDLEAMRRLLETIRRLATTAARPRDDTNDGAVVVHLEAERERRTGR